MNHWVILIFVLDLLVQIVSGKPIVSNGDKLDNDESETNSLSTQQGGEAAGGVHTLGHWSYDDPQSWKKEFNTCGGKLQSPIDIDPAKAVKTDYPKLIFGNYEKLWPMSITNNGHTVLLDLEDDLDGQVPYVSGGGLQDRFNFAQLHFHWGKESDRGSEHLIRSKQYSGELHIVHYNSKYGSFVEAAKHQDGIAVLGVLMETGARENDALEDIVDQFDDIIKSGKRTDLNSRILLSHLLPGRSQNFFRYTGSLTSPACQEVVSWIVFETPIVVSEEQLEKFRELLDPHGENLVDNFRPVQKYNGRIVTYHSEDKQTSESSNTPSNSKRSKSSNLEPSNLNSLSSS